MRISFAAEQDFIRRARLGEQEAFEQLVNTFAPDLFRVVRRMSDNSGDAEAVVQETFWRVWQALPRYREDRRFFPYLVAIAANLVRDSWRKQRRLLPNEPGEEVADRQPPLELSVEQAELTRALVRAVEELPAPYRAVIALRYEAGMKYDEIAAALGLPVNTVRTHLHRAKSDLRERLEAVYGRDE